MLHKRLLPSRRAWLRWAQGCALVLALGCWGPVLRAQRQIGITGAPTTNAQKRIALVIGNGAYTSIRQLKNPSNDANDLAAILKNDLGFELIGGGGLVNLSRGEMLNRVREFGEALASGPSVGVFYYAGHGVQLNGKNYLIPVEINVRSEADIENDAVEMQYVLNKMRDARNGLNIVIMDACRNNPFEGRVRDGRDGLAEVRAAARAGSSGDYGNVGGRAGSLDDLGWYDDNSGNRPHEVGEKRANDWGLYDMHGNVWEWVQDWYSSSYNSGAVTDPRGPSTGSFRVFRGGSWSYSATYARAAFRSRNTPTLRIYDLGFRLARTPS